MPYTSGTVDVGEELKPLCSVPENGVRVRNTGQVVIYLGGSDLPGDGNGYPMEPGWSEFIRGAKPKESPVVPAPAGDLDGPMLYVRTADGTGGGKVSFIAAS